MSSQPLLELRKVVRTYPGHGGLFRQPRPVHAVAGVSLVLRRGETLGVVGESGSGKSTAGRIAVGLERPDQGTVLFDGKEMPPSGTRQWQADRPRLQMIYQDPMAALDRRLIVREQVREPLDIHEAGSPASRNGLVRDILAAVGLSAEIEERYPHELSGGQRQRVVLARALVMKPDVLVCDEAVSALDVSVQAQVVNLFIDLQAELDVAMMFISHDLRVVRQVSHRIAVMYLGEIVEEGPAEDIFNTPLHPYTKALVSASPQPGRSRAGRIILAGDPPNPAARPEGCAFHPRCASAVALCREQAPPLLRQGGSRLLACHRPAALK